MTKSVKPLSDDQLNELLNRKLEEAAEEAGTTVPEVLRRVAQLLKPNKRKSTSLH